MSSAMILIEWLEAKIASLRALAARAPAATVECGAQITDRDGEHRVLECRLPAGHNLHREGAAAWSDDGTHWPADGDSRAPAAAQGAGLATRADKLAILGETFDRLCGARDLIGKLVLRLRNAESPQGWREALMLFGEGDLPPAVWAEISAAAPAQAPAAMPGPVKCSACGTPRVRWSSVPDYDLCADPSCPDPMADYRREHPAASDSPASNPTDSVTAPVPASGVARGVEAVTVTVPIQSPASSREEEKDNGSQGEVQRAEHHEVSDVRGGGDVATTPEAEQEREGHPYSTVNGEIAIGVSRCKRCGAVASLAGLLEECRHPADAAPAMVAMALDEAMETNETCSAVVVELIKERDAALARATKAEQESDEAQACVLLASNAHRQAIAALAQLDAVNGALYVRVEVLEKALRTYGQCLPTCHQNQGPWTRSDSCTCGLDDALKIQPPTTKQLEAALVHGAKCADELAEMLAPQFQLNQETAHLPLTASNFEAPIAMPLPSLAEPAGPDRCEHGVSFAHVNCHVCTALKLNAQAKEKLK